MKKAYDQSRSFNEIIAEYGNGRLLDKLSEELAEVTRACADTNLKGALTLKLSIEPSDDGTCSVQAEVTAKAPRRGVGQAIFYADGAGNLSRRDPRQSELPLRSVTEVEFNG